ncbi:gamma-glutamyltransferase [Marinibactrum halimedae]|uniref:Glutathione hydrolase proenzyme n=1 Tax=Marinibactrum halimedae TaxID=1444977 RepID=A0AA37T0V0_9GAMM|nr:gamma-glutamyltransferase [Marinibactrum halimedae]MCD9460991.1 gamma-glutamyltransferase [Marinibactrum halimedae]GLS24779.1 gamma-glutamyltranspeptidase [Marinibactrum halimedae]
MKFLVFILASLIISAVSSAADRITGLVHATRSEVIAPNAMAATSQPLATQIALDIMKQGGNAIDAAIAANAALGLMEPTGCGIGGDLFAIVWDAKTQKLYGLNASGRSPQGLSYDQLQKELTDLGREDLPPYGMLPISVPGAVDGWFELHNKFGQLGMDKILQPAINYGRSGFPVSELIAHYWNLSVPRLSPQPGAFAEHFTIDGRAPRKGEIFRNPALANTYQLIAQGGRDAFYKGDIAKKIDAFMQSEGGYLRYGDFAAHRSDWVEPLGVDYKGYTLWELPPNGQGIAALQMLQMLKNYDLGSMGFNSVESLHTLVEAKKLAYEDRAKFYSDLSFQQQPVKKLISKKYGKTRAKLIGERAAQRVESGHAALGYGDTIYLTTADKEGNMVSLIQSNYRGMGSGVVVPGLGFVFQDRGQMFSMDKDHANVYAPAKRPFHTIIPAFVTKKGRPFMSYGVMGGGMQPQGHVQILVNMVDYGMNVQEAGDAPRWQHLGSTEPTEGADTYLVDGGYIELETGVPYQVVRELMQKGHKVRFGVGGYGGYQAIMRDENGVYYGASESRKDGAAAGF